MGYQVYKVGRRWGGYGVPSYCEHPKCKKVIDRGMSYACGGEPFSEHGCDLYFCSKHLLFTGFTEEGEICEHEEDCDCEYVEVCERCAKGESSFDYKPEHPKWVKHLLKDPSWEEWRTNHPDEVKDLTPTPITNKDNLK